MSIQPAWVTNGSADARMINAADRAYTRARKAAESLCLADKIEAHRQAKEARDAAYAEVREKFCGT